MPAPVIDAGTFGAIAYSPSTGKIGYAYGFGDGEAAKANAVSSCGVGDCAWQVMESNHRWCRRGVERRPLDRAERRARGMQREGRELRRESVGVQIA